MGQVKKRALSSYFLKVGGLVRMFCLVWVNLTLITFVVICMWTPFTSSIPSEWLQPCTNNMSSRTMYWNPLPLCQSYSRWMPHHPLCCNRWCDTWTQVTQTILCFPVSLCPTEGEEAHIAFLFDLFDLALQWSTSVNDVHIPCDNHNRSSGPLWCMYPTKSLIMSLPNPCSSSYPPFLVHQANQKYLPDPCLSVQGRAQGVDRVYRRVTYH